MNLLKGPKDCLHCIGEFQSRLLLTTMYFLLLAPFSVLAGQDDPLKLKEYARTNSGWMKRKPVLGTLAEARQQF